MLRACATPLHSPPPPVGTSACLGVGIVIFSLSECYRIVHYDRRIASVVRGDVLYGWGIVDDITTAAVVPSKGCGVRGIMAVVEDDDPARELHDVARFEILQYLRELYAVGYCFVRTPRRVQLVELVKDGARIGYRSWCCVDALSGLPCAATLHNVECMGSYSQWPVAPVAQLVASGSPGV